MPTWIHDGLTCHYREAGQGLPFLFQHGLGADAKQSLTLYPPPPGVWLLAADARGHGQSPLGPPEQLTLANLADDLVALLDTLKLPSAVVGGTSMGAAVALNLAVRFPDRVRGLVLSRPAWLNGPMQRHADVFAKAAQLLRRYGPVDGKAKFRLTDEYLETLGESAASAQSLLSQFDEPRAVECVVRLEKIPRDAPLLDLAPLMQIKVPTLVLANRQDSIHPFNYGQILARKITGAEFQEVTPKAVSQARHAADVQDALTRFLTVHFLKPATS